MIIGLFYLFFGNLIGSAFTPLFVKLGTHTISPVVFTFFRFFVATVFFAPVYWLQRERISKDGLKILIVQAIFLAINSGIYSIGIQYTSIIISQILYTFVPIITGILSWIFLKERFTKEKIIGGFIAFSGVMYLLSNSFQHPSETTYGKPLGNALILVAVVAWSIYLILAKKLSKKYKPFTLSFYGFFITAIFLFIISSVEFFLMPHLKIHFTPTSTISIVGVGIVSIILIVFIQMGTKKTTAFTSSLFLYLGPFFSSITSIPFFHEKITPHLILGGILIMIGVLYATAYKELISIRRIVIQYFYGQKKQE